MQKYENKSMDDKDGNCRQCGHPFEPHLVIAFDKDNLNRGGVIKCPITRCKCHHTWDFGKNGKKENI